MPTLYFGIVFNKIPFHESPFNDNTVRDRAPGPFYEMMGQTHMNGWRRVIAFQNGGSTDYIFPPLD